MPKGTFLLILPIFIGLLAACVPPAAPTATAVPTNTISENINARLDSATPEPTIAETAESEPLPTITLPISLYIIDDAAGVNSSQRTEDELTAIYDKVNNIWSQANIVFEIQTIERLALSAAPLQGVLTGNFQPFFNSLGQETNIPEPSLLNGFYSQNIGGPNGIAPLGTRIFFVMDTPSVHDERVSSHELGHILGLHHVQDDPDRLMFSGTNGMTLTPEEITVARYYAQGILDRLR